MSNFRKQFKQGDDYCDIRADYRSLISIGKSVEEPEDLLLRAYCPKDGDLLFTPTFWLSLGICEWETGRLTPRTKEEALYCLSLYQETVEQRLAAGPNERLSDMLQFFRETQEMLLSPLPEAKKISKPYYLLSDIVERAKVADMGDTKKTARGYDRNAWIFEALN